MLRHPKKAPVRERFEREVEWPPPQRDPKEERAEPWARKREGRLARWKGWRAARP